MKFRSRYARLSIWLAGALMVSSCALQDQFAFAPDARPASLPAELDARALSIETDDGEKLVAWHAEAAPGCPTILGFHGNAQHLEGVSPRLDRMSKSGVGYLATAFRGYSGSSGKPTEKGVRLDADAAYAALIQQDIAPEEIVIEGFSLGSSIAIGLAAKKEAKALVLLAPFESGTRLAQDSMRFLPIGLLAGNAFRSDRLAENVTEPVLILHGDADSVVAPMHSADLQEHFSNTSVKRQVVPGRNHNDLTKPGLDTSYLFPFLVAYFPDCEGLIKEAL